MSYSRDRDATAYAYEYTWAHLQIINLTAKKSSDIENPDIAFKAFIKSFRDNFNPGWQETQYPNQSVPIAHQSMPKRTIQIEWTVPSTNAEEAIMNLQKCSWLAQSMYPTLKQRPTGYIPKSTFMAIKFANLIQANNGGPLPGYISSFSYTPNFIEGIHILKSAEAPETLKKYFVRENGRHLFPSLVDITIEFKPIQTRDSFGLIENSEQKIGWNNSSWPYGIQIDPRLKPISDTSTASTSTTQGAGTEGDVNAAGAGEVLG
jgi:hypothetical protein